MKKSCYNCQYCIYEDIDYFDENNYICNNESSDKTVIEDDNICKSFKERKMIKYVPLHEKKRFELNNCINIDILRNNGFELGGWIKEVEGTKYFINANLVGDIDIHLEISVNDNIFEFDDFKNIYVIDDNFCQPYIPFYDSKVGFSFLNDVIDKYNDFMGNLVNNGILKEKELNNQLQRKLIK